MAKYFLRSSSSKGSAVLYTRVASKSCGINWWVCSRIRVDIEAWNKAQKSASALKRYFDTEDGKKVQKQMELVDGIIDDTIKNEFIKGNKDKYILDDKIADVINADAIEAQVKVAYKKFQEEERRKHQIWSYYDYFLKGIEKGTILKKRGEKYKPGTVKVWKDFGKFMKEYTPETMTFDEISKRFADGFTVYLEGLGLLPKTVNKHILTFRALCNAAAIDEVNTNLVSVKVWRERTVKDTEKRAEIALSNDEIDALYNMPLTGIREQVRDIWCLGYFSGQRVSDYAHFTRDNFKVTKNGVNVIALRQTKTGNEVVVPILDDRVYELCEKYNYEFPKITRREVNRYIKETLCKLADDMPSLNEWVTTRLSLLEVQKEKRYQAMRERVLNGEILHGEELKTYNKMKAYADSHGSGETLFKRDYAGEVIRHRWEMVSSHTSRRSAVTSLYDSGLYDVRDMMSISGHTTQNNFEQYIKRGAIQQAERIAEKFKAAKVVNMKRKEA